MPVARLRPPLRVRRQGRRRILRARRLPAADPRRRRRERGRRARRARTRPRSPRWSPRATSRCGWSTPTAARTPTSPASSTSAAPTRWPQGPREIVLDKQGQAAAGGGRGRERRGKRQDAGKAGQGRPAPKPPRRRRRRSRRPPRREGGLLDGGKSLMNKLFKTAEPTRRPRCRSSSPKSPVPADAPLPPRRAASLKRAAARGRAARGRAQEGRGRAVGRAGASASRPTSVSAKTSAWRPTLRYGSLKWNDFGRVSVS